MIKFHDYYLRHPDEFLEMMGIRLYWHQKVFLRLYGRYVRIMRKFNYGQTWVQKEYSKIHDYYLRHPDEFLEMMSIRLYWHQKVFLRLYGRYVRIMRKFKKVFLSNNCVNPDSFYTCYYCNACGKINKDTMLQDRLKIYENCLKREYKFKEWDNRFFGDKQEKVMTENIKYFRQKIAETKDLINASK